MTEWRDGWCMAVSTGVRLDDAYRQALDELAAQGVALLPI